VCIVLECSIPGSVYSIVLECSVPGYIAGVKYTRQSVNYRSTASDRKHKRSTVLQTECKLQKYSSKFFSIQHVYFKSAGPDRV
jgi:hypothetical protein